MGNIVIIREKSSQSQNSHILALRDEKNRKVCLMEVNHG
jgi:hypothetical protein